MNSQPLTGKVALVTGASSGIGRACALALADAGAAVALGFSSNARGADEVAALVRDAGGRASTVGADLADPSAGAALVDHTIRELGASKTVLLSTHILQEVDAMADRVIFINQGRIVFDGTPAEMRGGYASLDEAFRVMTNPKTMEAAAACEQL